VILTAKIWISWLARPNLLPVLACCHICTALECAFERAECFKSHLVCDCGNRVTATFQMLHGVFNSQDCKPAVEANSDLFVKKGAEIGAFEIDDIRSLLQADFLVIVLIAKIGQTPQIWIVGKCFYTYFI
jgi:hypothetical protein